ncbi:MAG TPA: hypothetical protein VJT10_15215 [Steroidobacteraceae bacterium]|nr:hypothetical protein [Steroidobacteraceae bacterium]
MIDEGTLRQLARQAIQAGKLPSRRPAHVWGGNGFGTKCAVCGNLVNSDEVGYELRFAAGEDLPPAAEYHVHVRCFAAWNLERHSPLGPAGDADPLPADPQGVTISPRERPSKPESA